MLDSERKDSNSNQHFVVDKSINEILQGIIQDSSRRNFGEAQGVLVVVFLAYL